MSEAKRKRVLFAVFVLAVLWGLYMQPWKRRDRRQPEPTPVEQATVSPAAATVMPQPAIDIAALTAVSEWGIDPFRPTAPSDPADPEEPRTIPNVPVLQGTMTVRGAEVCVIDGQTFKVGERAGSWTVIEIDNGEVTLMGPNQERVTLNARDAQRK